MNKNLEKFVEPKVEVISINKNKDIVQTSGGLTQAPLFGGKLVGFGN